MKKIAIALVLVVLIIFSYILLLFRQSDNQITSDEYLPTEFETKFNKLPNTSAIIDNSPNIEVPETLNIYVISTTSLIEYGQKLANQGGYNQHPDLNDVWQKVDTSETLAASTEEITINYSLFDPLFTSSSTVNKDSAIQASRAFLSSLGIVNVTQSRQPEFFTADYEPIPTSESQAKKMLTKFNYLLEDYPFYLEDQPAGAIQVWTRADNQITLAKFSPPPTIIAKTASVNTKTLQSAINNAPSNPRTKVILVQSYDSHDPINIDRLKQIQVIYKEIQYRANISSGQAEPFLALIGNASLNNSTYDIEIITPILE